MNTIVRQLRSSHALKGQTVLLILEIHLQGMEREVKIHPIVVGVQGPPMERENIHTYTHKHPLLFPNKCLLCCILFFD
jgi:hypothetical protein